MKEKLLEMMRQLIDGEYNCNDFSYDFPEAMLDLKDEEWLDMLDDMPEICASYEPFDAADEEVLNDKELIQAVTEIYHKILLRGDVHGQR